MQLLWQRISLRIVPQPQSDLIQDGKGPYISRDFETLPPRASDVKFTLKLIWRQLLLAKNLNGGLS